ncbi:MAG TPA: tryptophan--tRNA ligase [Candidatus Paceibacterota bacterium]|nr:tryptophan--tRNA ligase [Candidatus Paceibacterota bacterium]
MSDAKKRLLSGVKPTGRPHIGNYFGAMKQFVDLAGSHESFVFVADYHALNFVQDGSEMRQLIIGLVKDYLAIGLDPAQVTLFKQSDVSEHAELAWIFDTITTMPYLMRAHAFKDAEAKSKEISVGTFNYPMLMAADILLYDADAVPVGQDQKQHIEYARDTAEKFNRIFGETFALPEEIIPEAVATVPGTDGRKMSKSYGNTIPLFGSREEIEKAVMGIVTDSAAGRPANVYAIHALLKPQAELESLYAANEGSYKALKEALIEDLDAFIAPLREKRDAISDEEAISVLSEGGRKAKAIASAKMADVRRKIGVTL